MKSLLIGFLLVGSTIAHRLAEPETLTISSNDAFLNNNDHPALGIDIDNIASKLCLF